MEKLLRTKARLWLVGLVSVMLVIGMSVTTITSEAASPDLGPAPDVVVTPVGSSAANVFDVEISASYDAIITTNPAVAALNPVPWSASFKFSSDFVSILESVPDLSDLEVIIDDVSYAPTEIFSDTAIDTQGDLVSQSVILDTLTTTAQGIFLPSSEHTVEFVLQASVKNDVDTDYYSLTDDDYWCMYIGEFHYTYYDVNTWWGATESAILDITETTFTPVGEYNHKINLDDNRMELENLPTVSDDFGISDAAILLIDESKGDDFESILDDFLDSDDMTEEEFYEFVDAYNQYFIAYEEVDLGASKPFDFEFDPITHISFTSDVLTLQAFGVGSIGPFTTPTNSKDSDIVALLMTTNVFGLTSGDVYSIDSPTEPKKIIKPEPFKAGPISPQGSPATGDSTQVPVVTASLLILFVALVGVVILRRKAKI